MRFASARLAKPFFMYVAGVLDLVLPEGER